MIIFRDTGCHKIQTTSPDNLRQQNKFILQQTFYTLFIRTLLNFLPSQISIPSISKISLKCLKILWSEYESVSVFSNRSLNVQQLIAPLKNYHKVRYRISPYELYESIKAKLGTPFGTISYLSILNLKVFKKCLRTLAYANI